MRDPRSVGPWLRRFLAEYIVTERNLARNTQQSYRDTFALLLPFVSVRIRKPVDRLMVEDLSARRVLQFLAHLENERGCSVQTRNQRLTAIRAFARFVASRDPAHLEWSANIRSIAVKKAVPQPISWLSKDEMDALLKVPDRQTPRGRIEHVLLLFLYNSGARVSEATELHAKDLQIGHRATAGMRSSPSTARAGSSVNVRCGRVPNVCLRNWYRDGQPAMPSSSAGTKGPIPGSACIGWSSAARPVCRRSPQGRSRPM